VSLWGSQLSLGVRPTTHIVVVKESSGWIHGVLPWAIFAGLPACGQSARRPEQAVRSGLEADSARLAHIALDSANRSSGFISKVFRYEPHGDSIRIVTIPDQRGGRVIDGMSIIWLRRDGRILRLTWTDSA